MSLSANIDHLAIAAGIEAVVVDTGSREYRGEEKWHRVLDGALDLFRRTDERSIRLVVGKHTIVVQQEAEETVAVVLPTGHAIAKSLRRMIRRMARKDRGPLPKDFLAREFPAGYSDYDYPDQAANERRPEWPSGQPVHSTPNPSPVSSPMATPVGPTGQPSPKTGVKTDEKPERETTRSERAVGGTDRGGFHNF